MTDQPAHAAATIVPPAIAPESGWIPCDPFGPYLQEGTRESFVSPGVTGGRLRIAYFRRPEDRSLVGRAWFGPETEGPPGHAHGGSVASILDEALGAVAYAEGHPVVVARLTVDFRAMVPIGTDATFETWIDHIDGRKIHTRGRLTGKDRELLAEGHALCVMLGEQHIEKFRAARRRRQAEGRTLR